MRLNRVSVRSWLLALYIVTIIVVAIGKAYGHRGPDNNFLVFRWSFLNLAGGHDMYASQPQHHADLYKYSPSFAVLFAPFALIPFSIALGLWDALNSLLLFFAVERLLPSRQAAVTLAIGAAVKIFPLAALALAIFYPRRIRFALLMVLAMAVVLALPLLVASPATLAAQYHSWRAVESVDALSVVGVS